MSDTPSDGRVPDPEGWGEKRNAPSYVLLQRWCGGDQDAAEVLYHRYAEPLVERVRSQLS